MNEQMKETIGNWNFEKGNLKNGTAMNSVFKFQFFRLGICLEFSAYDLVLRSWNFFPAGSGGKSLVPNGPLFASFRRDLVSFGVVSASFGRALVSVFPPKNQQKTAFPPQKPTF
jgi:hypothetical protein